VFAKPNISNGPQQVDNGTATTSRSNTHAHAPAQAGGEIDNQQTKLLEGTQHGGTVLDAGTVGAAARGHQTMEALGAIHRAEERRGEGHD
jgi:molybdenum cofactor biosynthesis enzyme